MGLKMIGALVMATLLVGSTLSRSIEEEEIFRPVAMKRRSDFYNNREKVIQDMMLEMYSRGLRSDPDVGVEGEEQDLRNLIAQFQRKSRGQSRPQFLNNHADAVMRGLG